MFEKKKKRNSDVNCVFIDVDWESGNVCTSGSDSRAYAGCFVGSRMYVCRLV